MNNEKIAIRAILRHYWKKGLSARSAAAEINDIEGQGSISKSQAAEWFCRFREGDISLEDKSRSGRPRTLNDELLCQQIEQHPGSSTRNLSAEHGSSKDTVARHLHQLGFANRRPRLIPHELTEEQAKKRVTICKQLLANPQDLRFWRRIVTVDEKWVFFHNPDNRNQWIKSGKPAEPVVKQGRFDSKVMLCIWWNFEGPVYWELLKDGHAVDGKLYSEQLDRVYEVLRTRYPELINRKRALLQHDNAPAHKSKLVQKKLADLEGLDVLPHPAYSPDLAPSDFYLFRSMAHFLRGRHFYKISEVEDGVRDFLASKPPEWYKIGIQKLGERWTKTVAIDGLYFEKD
jgi:[histone H3]-lysine36 N-dimethyltransferase SETMAR